MAAVTLGPVAVVGLGVIGGSVAKALTRAGVPIRAFSTSDDDRREAARSGIEVADGLASCVNGMPTVVVAVPLTAHAAVVEAIVAAASADAALFHAASLQAAGAISAATEPERQYRADVADRVIGTHPIAGSHRAGFGAADPDLFTGCIVSVEQRARRQDRVIAEALWNAVGAARVEYRTAEEHDDLMTWTSHLPQLASTALALTLASRSIAPTVLGPGGRDATRLASSPFDMWRGILVGGRLSAVEATAALERSLAQLRAALESGDLLSVEELWTSARTWRDGE